jgi:fimbrial chaperone protein
MMKRILKQATCGLFILLTGVSVVSAGSFGISPVIVTLSANKQVSEITLNNPGTDPMSVQLEMMAWSQQEGKDVFTPTREVLVNPPIFTVPANGSQLIRLGIRRAPDAQRELSYRLFLQELPSPISSDFQGTLMLMRVSLPVFILPQVEAKQLLRWQVARTPQNTLKVSLTNDGSAHIKIKNLKLLTPNNLQSWVDQGSFAYVLPGQSHDWIMSTNSDYRPPALGTALKLIAQTNTGKIEAGVMIAP